MFSAIYRYRGFIIDSVKRDFQSRYQTSFLGAAWLILQPIAMISVYTLIFSELMRARPRRAWTALCLQYLPLFRGC